MLKVYLAYAIDQRGDHFSQEISGARTRMLGHQSVSWIFDPGLAFTVTPQAELDPSIRNINREALLEADLVVAILPRDTVSIGVPMEIEHAVSIGTPMIVISDAPSWMLQFDKYDEAWVFDRWSTRVERIIEDIDAKKDQPKLPLAEDRAGDPLNLPCAVGRNGELPRRSHHDDAGLDLIVSKDTWVHPGEFVDIPCDLSIQLPDWSWGLITGRSSTLRKRHLMVSQGVIDTGFRGALFAGVWNLGQGSVQVMKGERVAQLILVENSTRKVKPVRVSSLDGGTRGENGFGSTGV